MPWNIIILPIVLSLVWGIRMGLKAKTKKHVKKS